MFNNIFKSAPATFIGLSSLALITIGAGVVSTSLATMTKHQCATHSWPAEQHQAHVEFCLAEGHQVKLGPGY